MKIDIPTKRMMQRMIDLSLRKETNNIYKILDKYRERLIEIEGKTKHTKIRGIHKNK